MIDSKSVDPVELAKRFRDAQAEVNTARDAMHKAESAQHAAESRSRKAAEDLRALFEKTTHSIAIDLGDGYIVALGPNGVPITVAVTFKGDAK